jgi:hypothetical protein
MSKISPRLTSTDSNSLFWRLSHILLASFFLHVGPGSNTPAGPIAGISIKVFIRCLHRVCIGVTANHGISAWSVTDPALSLHTSLTACDSLALCIKLPLTVLAARNNITNTSNPPLLFSRFVRLSFAIMSNVAAALWGCTGLTVGVHHYNDNTIGAAFLQMAGIPAQYPQFNVFKYLISEKDARFIIVVNIESDFLPINNVLIGDILSVDLHLDGFHVSTFLWDTRILISNRTPRVAILASPANPTTGEAKTFRFTEPILCTLH